MPEKTKSSAVFFIFITILIDIIGLGILIPVTPQLIRELIRGDLSQASVYGGWLLFTYSLMQFFFSPILGNLSDRYGRRPVLLISLFGLGIDYLIVGFAPDIWWLFIGRLLSGICGASFTTAGAYIADISPMEKRAQNFGMIGAAFGLGFIIGPVLGGLLGQFGSRVPFFAAAGMSFLNFLYGYFILPESLKPENRRAFEWKRANPVGALQQMRRYPVILNFAGTLFLIYLAAHAIQSTWSYYTMKKFGWDEAAVGLSLGWIGLLIGSVQGGLTRVLIPKLGTHTSINIGLLMYTLGALGFAFASQGWMLYAIMIVYALGGLAGPSLQAILSSQVPMNAQGELQGILNSIISVTSIIGPPLMTGLFGYFSSARAPIYFPGAAFLLASFLILLSWLWAMAAMRKIHKG